MSGESRASRRSRLAGAEALHQAVRHSRDVVALIDQDGHGRYGQCGAEPLAPFQAGDDLLQRAVGVPDKSRELGVGCTNGSSTISIVCSPPLV